MEKAKNSLINTQANKKALDFIRQQFDFDTEDQPDTLAENLDRIDYLWRRGEELGLTTSIQQALDYLLTQEDIEIALDCYFLARKHSLKEILQLALDHKPTNLP